MEEKTETVIEATDVTVDVVTERVRAIVTIVVTAIVNVLNVIGYAIDLDAWLCAALSVASVACIVWSWWRNNNITEAAMVGDALTTSIKRGE